MNITTHKSTRPYIRFDFQLAAVEGTSVALVLAALIDHYEYFEKNKQLKNGKFFNTKEMLSSKTNLGHSAIRKAELKLVELGFISISPRAGTAGRLNDYIIHFDSINRSLEPVQPILKTDSIVPKDGLNQSLGQVEPILRTGESSQITNLNNEPIEISREEEDQSNQPIESPQIIFMSTWNNMTGMDVDMVIAKKANWNESLYLKLINTK
jgi:hypothetical protein